MDIIGGLVLLIAGGILGTILERLKKRHEYAFDRRAVWYEDTIEVLLKFSDAATLDPRWKLPPDSQDWGTLASGMLDLDRQVREQLNQGMLFASTGAQAALKSAGLARIDVPRDASDRDFFKALGRIYGELARLLAAEYRELSGIGKLKRTVDTDPLRQQILDSVQTLERAERVINELKAENEQPTIEAIANKLEEMDRE